MDTKRSTVEELLARLAIAADTIDDCLIFLKRAQLRSDEQIMAEANLGMGLHCLWETLLHAQTKEQGRIEGDTVSG